ncbi:MAG: hypothetical protein SPJ13_05790 [Bacteroidales bacterium]|nr:hypothetical protein [Bacteroidales bacterium]
MPLLTSPLRQITNGAQEPYKSVVGEEDFTRTSLLKTDAAHGTSGGGEFCDAAMWRADNLIAHHQSQMT